MPQSLGASAEAKNSIASLAGNDGDASLAGLLASTLPSGRPESSNNTSNPIDSLMVHQNYNNAFATRVFEMV